MGRFGRVKQSWSPESGPLGLLDSKRKTTGYEKFKLLLWKNYKIQTRHIVQTLVELLLPLLFSFVLVIVRVIISSDFVTEPTIYDAFSLKANLPGVAQIHCDRVFYTPKNQFLDKLMQQMNQDYFLAEGLTYSFTGFDTEEELVRAFIDLKNIHANKSAEDFDESYIPPPPLLGGIVFKNINGTELPNHIEYTIRLPASQRSNFDLLSERFGIKAAWFTELTYPLFQLLGPRAKDQHTGGLPGYFEEGFLYVQYALDSSITKMLLKENATLLEQFNDLDIKLQRFPYPPYIDDKYLFALQAFLPVLMMLSFIYPAINITKSVCHEKEKRLKESMKIMGLPNWLHWTAWFIKSYVFLIISVIIMTVILKIKWTGESALAVIPETDGVVFFVILCVFCFQLVGFAFCVSAFFSKANTGATASGVFWFLWYVPYIFLQPRYNLLSIRLKFMTSFMFCTTISYACQIICMFEGSGAGLQWDTIMTGASPDDDFSIADCLLMMFVNGCFYMVVTWYVEAVWPGEYGIPLPWYFPVTKWYWSGDIRMKYQETLPEKNKHLLNADNFETEPVNGRAGVQILGLTKLWDKKRAVNDMYLNMYEGQITALLGHNGAGKTTTMSMLTGIFPPSSGSALINGHDICRDIKGVRASLGLCPQHDILFDELTVEEHLYFFCRMKGMPKHKVPIEINRMITSLGLEPKRHAQAQTLSGGMKRKLSVGVALCAGSKVVLLDEPTSGMDPGARRSTWDLIQTEKKGRTIILSTHFMDEADLLGDRIAIMAEGEIQCCGSSLFLKKKYGGGYHLIIVKTPTCAVGNVTNVLKQTIPDVEVDQDVGMELSYSLNDDKSHLFPDMFQELENRKDELGIASYGASITTMEEVFMKVGKLAEQKRLSDSHEELRLSSGSVSIDTLHSSSASHHGNESANGKGLSISKVQLYQDEYKRNTGYTRRFQQFYAMIVKKVIYAVRNRVLLLIQMGIPSFYLAIVLLIMLTLPGLSDPSAHELTLDRYESLGRTITTLACDESNALCKSYEDFVGRNYVIEKVESGGNLTAYILDQELKDLPRVSFKYIVGLEMRNNDDTGKEEIIGYFNNQPFHTPPLSLNFVSNAILRTFTKNYSITVTNYPLPYSGSDTYKDAGSLYTIGFQVGYNIAFGMSFLAASFVVFLIQERETKSKHLQFVSGVEFPVFWLAGFLIDAINYIIPCFGIIGVLLIFRTEDFLSIDMQFRLMTILAFYGWAVIPFMYLWSFCFTVPSSGFVRMTIFNIFTGIASMLTVVIVQIPDLQLGSVVNTLNDIFLIFPNYALGMGIVQLSTNYQYHKQCSTFNLEFVCDAIPDNPCCAQLQDDYFSWKRVGIGKNLMYLYCTGILSFLILFISESKIFQTIYGYIRIWLYEVGVFGNHYDDSDELLAMEDSDVVNETERIRKSPLTSLFQTNNLVLKDLTKYYGNFLAVDHLNLAVKRGETFGLLGVNGAGKTTTFKMLTGDIPVTDGDAYLYTASVRKNIKKVHENLGYCPQFDAIIEEMTGRETIRLFARLRGIKEKQIDSLADKLAEELLFTNYIDKIVKGYSGGNKRKLSTALALVGNPPIVFLDEPTTGMDPVARRHLWNAITRVRESGTSIVLTSHSMEECEALCSTLAIMVNGRFRCLGSPQHLKSKFGEGYTLIAQITPKPSDVDAPFTRAKQELGRRRSSSMKIRRMSGTSFGADRWETDLDELRSFIEEAFPGCVLKDIHPGFVHYHVVNPDVTWGQMFKTMEIAKEKFKLEAYSVGQTSLEQVFLNFTKAQINIDN